MNALVALPVVIPMIVGALSLALWRSLPAQRALGVLGTGALLAASVWLLLTVAREGILVMHMGEWQGPFGIVLVADLLGAIMTVLGAITGFAVAVYSLATVGRAEEKFGYYPLLHLLLAGVSGAFLTGDIFNLYVWVEVLLVASFALLTLGGERAQMEGAIKYVTLNLLSSVLLLVAVGLTYGMFGTLNMADLADKFGQTEEHGLITVIGMLFLISFSIKAAAFPFFFWLPASYHTPHVAVSALFAGLLTKVGVYALFRFFTLMFDQDVGYTHNLLLWIAGFTMLTGVLTAAAQSDVRKILSFHIISQIGYMIVGLALYTPLALTGAVFYLIHNIIAKANLFLIAGIARRLTGSFDLNRIGGLFKAAPFLSALFLVSALGLAGIPPLSGFWAKLLVVLAALEVANWWIAGVSLGVGLLTLFSMTKIWQYAYWSPLPEGARLAERPSRLLYAPVVGLAALTLLLGVWSQPLIALGDAAAAELLDPSRYVAAVFGEAAPEAPPAPPGAGLDGGAP